MGHQLTGGAIMKLMQGVDVQHPVFQVANIKKIAGQGGGNRYRLIISDGLHLNNFAMLATQLNSTDPENTLPRYSVFRADKFISNSMQDKRVLIILELTVLAHGSTVGELIGNPVSIDSQVRPQGQGGNAASSGNMNTHGNEQGRQGAQIQPRYAGRDVPAPQPQVVSNFYGTNSNRAPAGSSLPQGYASRAPSSVPDMNVVPIRDLNPYNNKCAIKARVTNKPPIKTYSNSKGEGKLFNIDLLDDSGEIRMTGFNQSCDQFYESIEVNNVYYIKNFSVKNANKNFSTLNHDYELSFSNDTQVHPCTEDVSDVPTMTFNFIDIASIEAVAKDSIIDVIGVCKRRGDLQTIVQRTTNKELQKREIVLVDKTNREISLTLWGKQAEDFNDDSTPILAIKGAKVSDFGGKSLSMLFSSSMQVNPDIHESHVLRGWFDNEGQNSESQSLSAGRGAGIGGNATWKTIREANFSDQNIDPIKGDYFMTKVTLTSIKRDNTMYMACPEPNCNKKVIDNNNGFYRCEKCNKEFGRFKWRLMLNASFADFTDNLWATCFNEQSEEVLGMSADILGEMNKENPDAFDAIVKEAVFKSYIVKFRTKLDSFNNETRKKTQVIELHKLTFSEYAKKLTAEINECFS